ncbi:hypothetical protein [Caldisalinibacter kiritimatiensis]|uniref:Uncharacterized protein n=1 Tax=Caldisalinibacter kiritimatiensis TaxID=1304284 RepID=R1AVX0_9FIRM|nr:hypothetical protein [Caldisalinibacter kiritimatiensis]EOD00797.1 hypothetical protein L21TH_1168 [Caldisalinibacter kiritimatiensis]
MNNYTNTPNLNNSMNIRAYEIQEARKRMGTLNNQATTGMGMTNASYTNSAGLNQQTQNYTNQGLGYSNNMSNMTYYQNTPSLSSSSSVGYAEIQKAKQDMFQSSTPQNNTMY